jgi:hypothetical protein
LSRDKLNKWTFVEERKENYVRVLLLDNTYLKNHAHNADTCCSRNYWVYFEVLASTLSTTETSQGFTSLRVNI